MISVKINRDIQQYKSKVILNFSLREFISVAVAIVFVIPFHFFIGKFIPKSLTSWVELIVVTPVLLMGFFEYHGMPFERYIIQMIKSEILYPRVRKYISTNENFLPERKVKQCLRKNKKKARLLKRR